MKKNHGLEIIEYLPEHQPFFEKFNRVWIEKYFWMEPVDRFVLSDPEKAILHKGGAILMARWERQIAGTVALKKRDASSYELTKMTVEENYRGKGIGEALCRAAIAKARSLHAQRILLYSHTSLKHAIRIYRKLGFLEVPLEPGTYERCDIKMEIWLGKLEIIKADVRHAGIISEIGRQSFSDAFGRFFNKQEDLKNYLDYTYKREKIAESLAKPNNLFFLSYLNDRPSGFAKMKKQSLHRGLEANRQTELQKIYVLKEYHGTGIAQALFQSVMEMAKDIKPTYLWLDVLVQNTRAIRFYEKNGFSKWSDHFFRIGSQRFEYHLMLVLLDSAKKPSHAGHVAALPSLHDENNT